MEVHAWLVALLARYEPPALMTTTAGGERCALCVTRTGQIMGSNSSSHTVASIARELKEICPFVYRTVSVTVHIIESYSKYQGCLSTSPSNTPPPPPPAYGETIPKKMLQFHWGRSAHCHQRLLSNGGSVSTVRFCFFFGIAELMCL